MRCLVSGVAGLLAVILLPVALLVAWVTSVGTDTDQFVRELRPVASSPEVREALTERVLESVEVQLKVPDPIARQLAAPLRELVTTVLEQPEVERAWESGLRGAHREFLAVMEGERPARVDSTGHVVMPLTIEVTGVDRLLDRFGVPVRGSLNLAPEVPIALFSVDDLTTARRVYAVGAVAGSAAPWIVVALAALALILARRRVRALGLLGVGGLLAAAAFAGAIVLGRDASTEVVADPIGSAVVAAAYRHAEDGLMAEVGLALWVSAGLLAIALAAGVVRVIFRRRG
ncbi:hypothetical protein [Intrasporangium sp. DVR]|uniref:hypothetical protein n=1 Tax=Intrasporangium sp. DVR TaxID=3127867 RepID=UPI00313A7046